MAAKKVTVYETPGCMLCSFQHERCYAKSLKGRALKPPASRKEDPTWVPVWCPLPVKVVRAKPDISSEAGGSLLAVLQPGRRTLRGAGWWVGPGGGVAQVKEPVFAKEDGKK